MAASPAVSSGSQRAARSPPWSCRSTSSARRRRSRRRSPIIGRPTLEIAWHLARFITEVRSIQADPVVLRQDWRDAYNYVTDKGALALDDYARSSDPFSKVGKTQISVDVASVIRASDDSLRVEWVERRTSTTLWLRLNDGAPSLPSWCKRRPTPIG